MHIAVTTTCFGCAIRLRSPSDAYSHIGAERRPMVVGRFGIVREARLSYVIEAGLNALSIETNCRRLDLLPFGALY